MVFIYHPVFVYNKKGDDKYHHLLNYKVRTNVILQEPFFWYR